MTKFSCVAAFAALTMTVSAPVWAVGGMDATGTSSTRDPLVLTPLPGVAGAGAAAAPGAGVGGQGAYGTGRLGMSANGPGGALDGASAAGVPLPPPGQSALREP